MLLKTGWLLNKVTTNSDDCNVSLSNLSTYIYFIGEIYVRTLTTNQKKNKPNFKHFMLKTLVNNNSMSFNIIFQPTYKNQP